MLRYPVFLLNAFWLLISAMLIVGVTQPMFTFTHFYFFDDTFSLTSGIFHLLTQNEVTLFLILFCFSLLMPALKMLLLLHAINASLWLKPYQDARLRHIGLVGKWSMLDVFVIAILAVTIKLSMIAQITIHAGLIIFSAGVILSMILPLIITQLHRRQLPEVSQDYLIVLADEQLTSLTEHSHLSVSAAVIPNYYIGLADIYDSQQQWQAKVSVSFIDKNHSQLQLIATARTV